MKYKTRIRIFDAVCSLILVFSAVAAGQRRGSYSDSSITRSVKARIQKLRQQNPRSRIRIDVNVKNGTVRLLVRRAPRRVHREVARYARRLRGVRKVEVTNPGCSSEGCPKNTYSCNGECVPCITICTP